MKNIFRPAIGVTLFSLSGMLVGFAIQVFVAKIFGTQMELDAFLVASTLPQYIVAVLSGALGVVLIPVILDYVAEKKFDEAWEITCSVLNAVTFLLALFAGIAMVFARPLVEWTAPGLSSGGIELATTLARILWPMVVTGGLASMLTAVYQIRSSFVWPAGVVVIGLGVNLLLLLFLGARFGIVALAWATFLGTFFQAVLLVPVLFRRGKYRFTFGFKVDGVRRIWILLWPLILSGFFIRATTIVDRYVASALSPGSISQLGYAYKIIGLAATLLSTGVATVLFPRMAALASENSLDELKNTLSTALRMMWLVVAPVIVLIFVLAMPVGSILFERGAFTEGDTQAVGFLLAWYSFSLAGMCLGALTGRVFYVMKDTKTISVMGVLEMVAYAIYTPLLGRRMGSSGIAIAYFVYFTVSLVWHAFYIWVKLDRPRLKSFLLAFVRIGFSAILAGMVAYALARLVSAPVLQILIGGGLGMVVHVILLKITGSMEVDMVFQSLRRSLLSTALGSLFRSGK